MQPYCNLHFDPARRVAEVVNERQYANCVAVTTLRESNKVHLKYIVIRLKCITYIITDESSGNGVAYWQVEGKRVCMFVGEGHCSQPDDGLAELGRTTGWVGNWFAEEIGAHVDGKPG